MPLRHSLKSSRSRTLFIATTPRSGSSLLASYLAQTRCFGIPDEWLHPRLYEAVTYRHGLDPNGPRSQAWPCLRYEATAADGRLAIKTMWDVFGQHLSCLRAEHPEDAALPAAQTVARYFHHPAYVFWRRRSLTRQAISHLKAHQTEEWHFIERGSVMDPTKLVFDPAKLVSIEADLCAQERSWWTYFREAGIQPLVCWYEDFVRDPQATLRAIARHCGLDPDALPPCRPSKHSRVRDAVNAYWLECLQSRVQDTPHPTRGMAWLRLKPTQPVIHTRVGQPFELVLELENTGPAPLDFLHPEQQASHGIRWEWLGWHAYMEHFCAEIPVPARLEPGKILPLHLRACAPPEVGLHQLRASLTHFGPTRVLVDGPNQPVIGIQAEA